MPRLVLYTYFYDLVGSVCIQGTIGIIMVEILRIADQKQVHLPPLKTRPASGLPRGLTTCGQTTGDEL